MWFASPASQLKFLKFTARVKELRVGLKFLKKEGLYWMVDTVLNLFALIAVPLSQTFYY